MEKDILTMGRREGGESGLLSAAGSRSFYLRRAPAGSTCVLTEDKPPTVVHLDTLGTWSLITKRIKVFCLVSQRFVRAALCSGIKPNFYTFGGQPN